MGYNAQQIFQILVLNKQHILLGTETTKMRGLKETIRDWKISNNILLLNVLPYSMKLAGRDEVLHAIIPVQFVVI